MGRLSAFLVIDSLHIKIVYFATSPKLLRTQPIIFAFFAPKNRNQDNIRSQFQRPTSYIPEYDLDQAMPSIVFWFFCILTKEAYVPLIRCQSKRQLFMFKLLC